MKSSKIARVLELLLARGDRGLNRFEAVQEVHDFVLPSTVANLHAKGVRIVAQPEDVPGFGGHSTRCARYAIPASERARAREILAAMKQKRPASPTAGLSGSIGGRADATRKSYH